MSIFKTRFTEEDIKLQDLIKSFLSKPETLIEINPSDMSYILSFEPLKYYIEIDSVGVKLSNHNFDKDIRLDAVKLDVIKALVRDETIKRREARKALIFKNKSTLLDTITKNVLENGK